MASYDSLCRRAVSLGLAVRGAFHPAPGEFALLLPETPAGTILLLGFTGSRQWDLFTRSAEASDGRPQPLDRWSRRVIGLLARESSALDVYPNGSVPRLPFQLLAARCEPVHQSPIGLLIHAQWGLWHAYRGALILPERIELPPVTSSVHPCVTCAAKPCLSSCPVQAFRAGAFDAQACLEHLGSAAGAECLERGCRARRACPMGSEFGYMEQQAQFHMRAFRDLRRDSPPS
jgi:hypothetical protein